MSLPRVGTWSSTDLLMLSAVLIWGINLTVIKLALRSFSPLTFNALRFACATVIMLVIMRLRGETLHLAPRDLWPVVLLGLAGHTLYQVLFINGISRTTPANTSLLMATSPIFVVVYGRVVGIERTNRLMWAGVWGSFIGIAILIAGGGGDLRLGGGTLLGDLLIIGASLLWAVYTTASKPLLARYSPLKLTALSMVAGTVPLVLFSLPQLVQQDWGQLSPGAWGGWLYSSLFAVVVAYVIWYTSVQRVGNARTAIYSNLLPVVAVLVGWIVLGDRLVPLQALGAVLVLAGILLTRQGRAR